MKETAIYKKNILVITGGTYISGAEKVTLDVMQGLKKAGNNLFCIASGWTDGDFIQRLEAMQINYEQFKLGWYYFTNIRWSVDSLMHYPRAFLQFYRFFKAFHYDVIYVTSYRPLVLLYPLLKKNVVYHVHDPNNYSRQSRFFIRKTDKKVIKYIAVSQFVKKDLMNCGIDPDKIEVVYNGTEINESKMNVQNHGDSLNIGIVGQIIKRKGHEDVVEALKILKDKGLNVSLIIVGRANTDFAEVLKKLISAYNLTSYVSWRNYKNNISEIYEGIDVIVAPTRNDEPFALVALEAGALSIPVIATNKGGFPESIFNNHNGFLIEANNPLDLVAKISLFVNDRHLKNIMGNNGRKIVSEKFSKEKMVNEIDSMMQEIKIFAKE